MVVNSRMWWSCALNHTYAFLPIIICQHDSEMLLSHQRHSLVLMCMSQLKSKHQRKAGWDCSSSLGTRSMRTQTTRLCAFSVYLLACSLYVDACACVPKHLWCASPKNAITVNVWSFPMCFCAVRIKGIAHRDLKVRKIVEVYSLDLIFVGIPYGYVACPLAKFPQRCRQVARLCTNTPHLFIQCGQVYKDNKHLKALCENTLAANYLMWL